MKLNPVDRRECLPRHIEAALPSGLARSTNGAAGPGVGTAGCGAGRVRHRLGVGAAGVTSFATLARVLARLDRPPKTRLSSGASVRLPKTRYGGRRRTLAGPRHSSASASVDPALAALTPNGLAALTIPSALSMGRPSRWLRPEDVRSCRIRRSRRRWAGDRPRPGPDALGSYCRVC
jgi:hypothetical protein